MFSLFIVIRSKCKMIDVSFSKSLKCYSIYFFKDIFSSLMFSCNHNCQYGWFFYNNNISLIGNWNSGNIILPLVIKVYLNDLFIRIILTSFIEKKNLYFVSEKRNLFLKNK